MNSKTQSQDEMGKRIFSILLHIKGTTDIDRILNKYNIQTVFKPSPQKDRANFEKSQRSKTFTQFRRDIQNILLLCKSIHWRNQKND